MSQFYYQDHKSPQNQNIFVILTTEPANNSIKTLHFLLYRHLYE